jgi:8-oxo-dGTP pyrophosphatase MutT (NUDIX family)
MTQICAFALIFDDHSRLLLCRGRQDGKWNLPGGRAEAAEAPWAAVAREVREELGMDVVASELRGVYWVPSRQTLSLTFVCEWLDGTCKIASEITEVGWFARHQLPDDIRDLHDRRAADGFRGGGVTWEVQGKEPAELYALKGQATGQA